MAKGFSIEEAMGQQPAAPAPAGETGRPRGFSIEEAMTAPPVPEAPEPEADGFGLDDLRRGRELVAHGTLTGATGLLELAEMTRNAPSWAFRAAQDWAFGGNINDAVVGLAKRAGIDLPALKEKIGEATGELLGLDEAGMARMRENPSVASVARSLLDQHMGIEAPEGPFERGLHYVGEAIPGVALAGAAGFLPSSPAIVGATTVGGPMAAGFAAEPFAAEPGEEQTLPQVLMQAGAETGADIAAGGLIAGGVQGLRNAPRRIQRLAQSPAVRASVEDLAKRLGVSVADIWEGQGWLRRMLPEGEDLAQEARQQIQRTQQRYAGKEYRPRTSQALTSEYARENFATAEEAIKDVPFKRAVERQQLGLERQGQAAYETLAGPETADVAQAASEAFEPVRRRLRDAATRAWDDAAPELEQLAVTPENVVGLTESAVGTRARLGEFADEMLPDKVKWVADKLDTTKSYQDLQNVRSALDDIVRAVPPGQPATAEVKFAAQMRDEIDGVMRELPEFMTPGYQAARAATAQKHALTGKDVAFAKAMGQYRAGKLKGGEEALGLAAINTASDGQAARRAMAMSEGPGGAEALHRLVTRAVVGPVVRGDNQKSTRAMLNVLKKKRDGIVEAVGEEGYMRIRDLVDQIRDLRRGRIGTQQITRQTATAQGSPMVAAARTLTPGGDITGPVMGSVKWAEDRLRALAGKPGFHIVQEEILKDLDVAEFMLSLPPIGLEDAWRAEWAKVFKTAGIHRAGGFEGD